MNMSVEQAGKFSPSLFFEGTRNAVPIILGYLPLGFAYGVLAGEAGLSVLETALMSLLVFAGSSQFIAVNMILAGAPALSIVITTFVVNARHMLMSAAMVPFVRNWSRARQILFGFGLADEPFVMNISNFAKKEVRYEEALGVNVASYLGWSVPGIAGAITGQLMGDLSPLGLDFALAGLFIALLVPFFKERRELVTALIAGTLSVVLYLAGVGRWNIILATLAAATIGLLLPIQTKKAQQEGADASTGEATSAVSTTSPASTDEQNGGQS
ncbi:AzlC family ABC transporter permease [Desulfovibrio sp. OttesenSCG-928-C06]|nr:AzlC family ABC transporter permease [Desulfovibrio sp. OttesenSCG-928-C06]